MTDDNIELTEQTDAQVQETEDPSEKKEREDEYEKICFLCRRPESKAGKMIELPNNIHICTDCMQKSFDTMNHGNINYADLMQHMPNISMIFPDCKTGCRRSSGRKRKRKKGKNQSFPSATFRLPIRSKPVWTNM